MSTPFARSLVFSLSLLGAAVCSAEPPNDPLFRSTGTWGQDYADQWGLHRIGFPPSTDQRTDGESTIVAVIDTGLDYTHPDIPADRIWRNPHETLNGSDDDGNGYTDDVIGWNFVDADNNPWDRAGHGTHIAGIIAAATNNGIGIAGVDPRARIMPLKVLNLIGRGRSSHIAAAIYYAIANGAKVINLSLGGDRLSTVEERAIRKAHEAGAVTVIAAGNNGRELENTAVYAMPSVLVVAASDVHDHRARFSNWGRAIKITAPGVDILSLRARDTDLNQFSGAAGYHEGAAVVKNEFYRASGTSFAAAYVSGVASWLLSHRANLTGTQVARIIMQSARDIEAPGVDSLTGYGLIDAQAALTWDAETFIDARIDAVDLSTRNGATRVRVLGTADADRLAKTQLRAAPERYPNDWIEIAAPPKSIREGVIAEFEPLLLRGSRRWTLQLLVTHASGKQRESRFVADLGSAP